MIDAATLQRATRCTPDRAELYAPLLSEACSAYGINTPDRLSAFLAQVGHESGALRYTSEVWGPTPAQRRYEGRRDLGNNQPGDGSRFRGRGLIQTTGRGNYRAVTARLRARLGPSVPDFEAEPERLSEPRWAAWSAADYWDMRGLNALADAGDFRKITLRINGGYNGESDRNRRWEIARAALGATAARPAPIEIIAVAPEPVAARLASAPLAHTPEPAMVPSLLSGLAGVVINAFGTLAAEKVNAKLAAHVGTPVADQITTGIIDSVKAATGVSDPIAAVAAYQADPEAVARVEADTLEALERLAPVLERLDKLDAAAAGRLEDSRDRAEARARASGSDQDPYLTKSIVHLMVGMLVGGAVLSAVLSYLKVDAQAIIGALLLAAGAVVGEFKTRYQHRYGSSSGSASKDVLIDDVVRGSTNRRT